MTQLVTLITLLGGILIYYLSEIKKLLNKIHEDLLEIHEDLLEDEDE